MTNRIKELRKKAGLSLEQVAERAHTNASQIQKLESGQRRLSTLWMNRLAPVLGVRPQDFIAEESAYKVPVIGEVGAGAEVYPYDDYPLIITNNMGEVGKTDYRSQSESSDVLEWVESPPGLGRNGVALRVRGDSMMPAIEEGYIIYYNQRIEGDCRDLIGSLCVVKIKDGPVLVKKLKQGRTYGKYDLVSFNATILEDREIEWCAKVLFIRPS